MKNSSKDSGFSLVEVVLALGVASVALLSIVGLLGVAVTTSGNAGDDTLLVAMSNSVLNDLRAAEFDALWEASPRTAKNPKEPTGPPADSTYYFTNEGAFVPAADKDKFSTTYECVVRKVADPNSQLTPTSPVNLLKLELSFTWPTSANADPAKRPKRETIYASIARY